MKNNKIKRKARATKKKHIVLKLNKAYMPIDVCTWEEAVTDWANGRAVIEASYDDVLLRSGMDAEGNPRFSMNCPSVIRMINSNVSKFDTVKTLPLTRKNILDRDHGECAYCGDKLTLSTLTIDHVYPDSKGGLWDWANLRASCLKCNNTKGDKTLSELGWTLRRRVGVPTLSKGAPKSIVAKIGGRVPHDSWKQYIYWQVETKEKLRDI